MILNIAIKLIKNSDMINPHHLGINNVNEGSRDRKLNTPVTKKAINPVVSSKLSSIA